MSRKRKLAWLASVPVVLGVVATTVGLAFDLFPSIQPDPPCQGSLSGELNDLTVDESVSRATYFELTGASTDGIPADRLDDNGKLIHFDFLVEGFRDERVSVWTSVLTDGGAPVEGEELSNQLALELELEDCVDSGRRTVWTRTPDRGGQFLVELRLLDPDREELDAKRTQPFSVEA
jgi:hypothetical protein